MRFCNDRNNLPLRLFTQSTARSLLRKETFTMAFYLRFSLIVIVALLSFPIATAQTQPRSDPLVQVLVSKGVLTTEEARLITNNASPAEQRDRLAALLRDKGVISGEEFGTVRAKTDVAGPGLPVLNADYKTTASTKAAAAPQPSPPTVIAAVAPVRLLGIDMPKRDGLIPDIKLGTGARLKLYRIFKTSVIHDSSSPQGNDFPLPLLAADTGPNNSPEFHLRARGLRLGANFEWLDPAPKMVITGKIEFDFEGNFTRANNRNISSIRSSQPSLRLAWVRIDRRFNDNTSAFALFGQDWSPFVSSTMPNMIENTNFGGPGFGAAYERIPQARFGFNFTAGGSRPLPFLPPTSQIVSTPFRFAPCFFGPVGFC